MLLYVRNVSEGQRRSRAKLIQCVMGDHEGSAKLRDF